MEPELPEFKFAEFALEIEAEEDSPFITEHFTGGTVRGSVLFKAKKLFCVNPSYFHNCSKCILSNKCVYAQLFETQRPPDSAVMKKYRDIPHPFVMTPLKDGHILDVRIVLFGDYVEYFPYFYLVFKSLRQPKKYRIKSIKNGNRELLKNGDLSRDFTYISSSEIQCTNRKTISFLTPLRIKHNGRYVSESNFRFTYFFRNLVRRLSLISYFYGKEWNTDFASLVKQSEKIDFTEKNIRWENVERYSMRAKSFMPMGGIVGEAVLPEITEKLCKLIEIGHYARVGKNTSFGQGYYILK